MCENYPIVIILPYNFSIKRLSKYLYVREENS